LKFKEFGWNGFLLEIPEGMRLTSEGGNISSGYIRLEMEGLVAEVKWDPLDKKAMPLAKVADLFIKNVRENLEKKLKKKVDLKVESGENIFVSSHGAYSMILKTGAEFWEPVYIWNCEKSKRIIIVHFISLLPKDTGQEVVRHMLESLRCHQDGDFVTWSALNLRFNIPSSLLLSDRKIVVGRTYLTFEERKPSMLAEMGRSLTIEFFSMANIIYEDTYKKIDEWFQSKYWKDLKKRYKHISFQTSEMERVMRHNVLHKRGVRKLGLVNRRTMLCENLTWYCSKSNRIYSVTYTSYVSRPFFLKRMLNEEEDKRILQSLISSFRCHI